MVIFEKAVEELGEGDPGAEEAVKLTLHTGDVVKELNV